MLHFHFPIHIKTTRSTLNLTELVLFNDRTLYNAS
uniref:Uncharacterized protein n=1 Tax=Rhizophora mucronata TaxID=61149 RepID=A0A2P2NU32_RHIMU